MSTDDLMALVWDLVRSGPNYDGRDRDVRAALESALRSEYERGRTEREQDAEPVARPVAWMAMRFGAPAQSTTDEPTAIRWRKAGGDVRDLFYASPPATAVDAEPVAWIAYSNDRKYMRGCWLGSPDEDQRLAAGIDGDIIAPLYASPPARKRLTDERIHELVKDASLDWQRGFGVDVGVNRYAELVRSAERAHGIGDE